MAGGPAAFRRWGGGGVAPRGGGGGGGPRGGGCWGGGVVVCGRSWRARVRPARCARYEGASVIVPRGRLYAGPYVVAPLAALSEPLLHVCLFERWGRAHTLRFGLALLRGRLPQAGGYRVIAGRAVSVSVVSNAGE